MAKQHISPETQKMMSLKVKKVLIENLSIDDKITKNNDFESFRKEQAIKRQDNNGMDEFYTLQKWHDDKLHWREYYTDSDKAAIEEIKRKQGVLNDNSKSTNKVC